MINFFTKLPGWLLAHPWEAALIVITGLALMSGSILLNPDDKQLRRIWRRK